MLQYVREMPEGTYSAFHYPWTPLLADLVRQRRIKVVFLYRDPRAQVQQVATELVCGSGFPDFDEAGFSNGLVVRGQR